MEVLYEKTFFRFIYTVCKENIHITLLVNINETRVILVSGANNAIYEIKRAKQVLIYGKNEKCTFTSILLGSCKDKVLSV